MVTCEFIKNNKFVSFWHRLVVNQSQRVTFLDFENEKTISVYSKNDSKYDKDNAYYLMQAIKYKIISQAKKTDID